jgi:hypothetical protein
MMVLLGVGVAVGLVVFLSTFHPGGFGAPLVEGLPRVPRAPAAGAPVAQVLDVEVVASPDPGWPIMTFSFQAPRVYWSRVKVRASAGVGAPPVGAEMGLESKGATTRFLVCLDAEGRHLDGYALDADGRVRLVGEASPDEPIAPYRPTEPMPVAEAMERLLGRPGSTIPTKFRP